MNTQAQIILLVEDSPDDVFFMRYALKKAGILHPVYIATDGQQAIDYLQGTDKYARRDEFPMPTIIFLDIKLPFRSGFEVLAWMKNQPGLSHLPVFILTGSSEERDKTKARELGANGYYVKPPHHSILLEAMQSLNPSAACPTTSANPQVQV